MAVDDYDNRSESHHMRRDVRDAHTNSQVARMLAILALLTAAIALAVALQAMNKATDALNNANRALSGQTDSRALQ